MWFLFALITMLAWGTADMFYKKGADPDEPSTGLRTVIMVGLVMGVHAVFYMLAADVSFALSDMVKYLPVSFFYIISMFVGYVGLRYLMLSISSPVQNSSGAVTLILCCALFVQSLGTLDIIGVIIICVGVFLLALLEKHADMDELSKIADKKHTVSAFAILFPIGYCVLDSMGTFLDAIYLGEAETAARFSRLSHILENFEVMNEDTALMAYEFTFLAVGIIAFLFLWLVKKEKFTFRGETNRLLAAACETAGQFTYVRAMSGRAVIAAPMIASYSIVSLILGRLFLKEKLTKKQYVVVTFIILGIALLGVSEGLAE